MTDPLTDIETRAGVLLYAVEEGHPFAVARFASAVCREDIPFLLAEVARLRRVIERVEECVCFFDHKTVKGVKTDVLAILDEQVPIFTAMGLDEPESR